MATVESLEVQRANRSFIARSMRAPMLTREHETDLARRWRDHDDVTALHEIITAYSRLVVRFAGAYRRYGLPSGDLVQEGLVGLMLAASRFDPERGVRFSTYGSWWIRSAMQDFVLRNWSIVRTGTTTAQKALFFNLRRLRARIQGDDPDAALTPGSIDAIAAELKVATRDVVSMDARLAAADQSLNVTINEGGDETWQDLLVDQGPTPEDIALATLDGGIRSRWLAHAIDELNPRERAIIIRRRLSEDGITLEALGRGFGISKERVRQLEHRALKKIKQSIVRQSGGVTPRELFAA